MFAFFPLKAKKKGHKMYFYVHNLHTTKSNAKSKNIKLSAEATVNSAAEYNQLLDSMGGPMGSIASGSGDGARGQTFLLLHRVGGRGCGVIVWVVVVVGGGGWGRRWCNNLVTRCGQEKAQEGQRQ